MDTKIHVEHVDADQFRIHIGSHELRIDQPVSDDGTDTAPTPVELFVAALAGCAAFYARRYLARQDVESTGVGVEAGFRTGGHPNRITDIALCLTAPVDLPDARRQALLAVSSRCTLENTLRQPPTVTVELTDSERCPNRGG